MKLFFTDHNNIFHKKNDTFIFEKIVTIPCKNCIGCVQDYKKERTKRLILEAQNGKKNYFITLTLNEENKTKNVSKKTLSNFIKKLRTSQEKYFNNKIRYFGCGEYGSKTLRSHYHVIIFNLVYNNCNIEEINKYIENIRKKGHTETALLNEASAAYVAGYATKKQLSKYKNKQLKKRGIEPEFINMSRNPGIGALYVNKHKEELIKNGGNTYINGKKITLNNYLRNKLDDENAAKQIKINQMKKGTIFNIQNKNELKIIEMCKIEDFRKKEFNNHARTI